MPPTKLIRPRSLDVTAKNMPNGIVMKQQIKDQAHIILDSIADGVFTVDLEWKIISFNRAAKEITGIKKHEAIGRHCWEVFRASICEQGCKLRKTMETGYPFVNQSIFIVNSAGERIPVSISTALLKNNKGKIIGGVETFRDLSVVEELRKELADKHTFHDIISKSKEMKRLFGMLELIAESDTTVLIEGESGTGKELFAKAIHSVSNRRKAPLITINCSSIPDTLLESELFGYKAGAFTDAKKDKPGRLALAEGGTIFLDEIGDISQLLQVKLLRVLQDKIYEPLGSISSVKANVRIVVATNKNLEKLVKDGVFRDDLYYRVNVVKLLLPPLRKRKEDISLLSEHFIRKFNRLNDRNIQRISSEALSILMSHNFPGNIRELENIIEYANLVCQKTVLGIEHLPEYLHQQSDNTKTGLLRALPQKEFSFHDIEKKFIFEALRENSWNRSVTARKLGIHTTTLWRKIKHLKLEIPGTDGRSKK